MDKVKKCGGKSGASLVATQTQKGQSQKPKCDGSQEVEGCMEVDDGEVKLHTETRKGASRSASVEGKRCISSVRNQWNAMEDCADGNQCAATTCRDIYPRVVEASQQCVKATNIP